METHPTELDRRLAAFWFADLVGFSALSAADAAAALGAVEALRAAAQARAEEAGGRVVKLFGDAVLAEFPSADAAVRAALELRHDLRERARLHVGIHLGEVSSRHGDIYGEGVNLAARLQANAEPDQVLVSEDVYRHVRPNPAFRFEPLGGLTLKGIPGPVQAFVVERAEGMSWGRQPTVPRARPMNRLIVTPFRILRPDPETEFLAFSLADAVSFSLSNLGSIIVRSSHVAGTSPARAMVDPREIARQSDVDLVVTGTLLRVGERLQVTAELSDGGDGTRLGSFRTQAGLGDLFELQEELSSRIVDALALPLTAGERLRMRQDVPATSRAYELYLRANEQSHRGVDWVGARDLYKAALAEDPGYAPAWAQLARCHRLMAKYDTLASRAASFAAAGATLRRALELNPELDLAHSYSALLETELGRAGDAMERLLARLDVRPRNVDVLAGLVHVLRYCGLLDESFQADRSARALDPAARTSIAYTLFMRGDFEASTGAGTETDIYVRAMAQLVLGRDHEARASIEELDALESPFHRFAEPLQLLMAGRHDAVVDSGLTVYRDFPDPEGRYFFARILARVGRADLCLDLLEALAPEYLPLPPPGLDPWLAVVVGDARYTRLLESTGARRDEYRTRYRAWAAEHDPGRAVAGGP
jgi:class 3 adenylate cyclase/tetratricopeptide (TPR) repeat protein